MRKFEAIAEEVSDLVLKYGGALSGEHGDGLVRSPFQEKMYGTVLYQAFRELKRTFDPHNLLNPGKIVDAPPLSANLRYGPGYVTPAVATTFDFTADGGLLPAAELCAGVGACRKKREGTMCPSFQATRDEKDSTRGRANLLRMAITGQLGFEGFTDPDVREVLDLCLECKACKSECPTNVDMARLKAEFLHQYHRKHGLPWRNRFFGHVAELGRIGSALAPASSWLTQSGLSRWLNDTFLGIDRRRVPPAICAAVARPAVFVPALECGARSGNTSCLAVPRYFCQLFSSPRSAPRRSNCFNSAGCAVTLGPPGLRCCGRPLISNGLLDQAVANARHNVERLHDWASRGGTIIACEPSCILTIKDDYPALLKGELRAQAETVAQACLTFEEYFESILAGEASLPLDWKPGPGRSLCKHTVTSDRWSAQARCSSCCDESPERRSSTSTPAAAAWPARSATRPSITRSRGWSVNSVSCPRSVRPGQPRSWLHPGSRAGSRSSISPARKRFIRPRCFDLVLLERRGISTVI